MNSNIFLGDSLQSYTVENMDYNKPYERLQILGPVYCLVRQKEAGFYLEGTRRCSLSFLERDEQ